MIHCICNYRHGFFNLTPLFDAKIMKKFYKKFNKISKYLRNLKNYTLLFEILSALSVGSAYGSGSTSTLGSTWIVIQKEKIKRGHFLKECLKYFLSYCKSQENVILPVLYCYSQFGSAFNDVLFTSCTQEVSH